MPAFFKFNEPRCFINNCHLGGIHLRLPKKHFFSLAKEKSLQSQSARKLISICTLLIVTRS